MNLESFSQEMRRLLIPSESTQKQLPYQVKKLISHLKAEVGLDE